MTAPHKTGFEDRLWDELHPLAAQRAAAPTAPAPVRRMAFAQRVAVVVVLTAVIAGALALVLASRGGGDQVFAEELTDGRVRVTLDEFYDAPDVAQQELEAAGIAVVVEHPPGSPGTVGKVTNLLVDHDAAGVDVAVGAPDSGDVADGTIDPSVFDGTVTLLVPRAATPGEYPEIVQSVFFEDEPLAGLWCEQWPLTSQQFADVAAGRGLQVGQWEVVTSLQPSAADPEFSDIGIATSSDRPQGRVLFAAPATNTGFEPSVAPAGTLVVTVLPDDIEPTADVRRTLDPAAPGKGCGG